jgi:hypothetical protein
MMSRAESKVQQSDLKGWENAGCDAGRKRKSTPVRATATTGGAWAEPLSRIVHYRIRLPQFRIEFYRPYISE